MNSIEKELPKYEYMSDRIFNIIVTDIIMSKDNISEEQALEKINNLQIDKVDTILDDNTGSSLRKGTVETLRKLGYEIESLVEENIGHLQPMKNNY